MSTATDVRERPILFSAPMVRAILDGQKTQTRRVVNLRNGMIDFVGSGLSRDPADPSSDWNNPSCWGYEHFDQGWCLLKPDGPSSHQIPCPYGQPGDRLWVRETWADLRGTGIGTASAAYRAESLNADGRENADARRCREDYGVKWRPSIHMPRWASRITLEITDIRVERVREISRDDVIAEGICERDGLPIEDCHAGWHEPFAQLWDSINAKRGFPWADNPWVWVVAFKRIDND